MIACAQLRTVELGEPRVVGNEDPSYERRRTRAAGLAALRRALAASGAEVVVIAPEANRSGLGQRLNPAGPVEVVRVATAEGTAFAFDGTPIDCVRAGVLTSIADDDWLAEHSPSLSWSAGVMPMETSLEGPMVATVLGAGSDFGRPEEPSGLDSWYGGATFTRFTAMPTVAFGPSGLDGERTVAHTVDEFVPVEDPVACAQALTVADLRSSELA